MDGSSYYNVDNFTEVVLYDRVYENQEKGEPVDFYLYGCPHEEVLMIPIYKLCKSDASQQRRILSP